MFKQAITSIYERERERQVQMEREFNERIGMETLQAFRRLCDRLGVAADGASVNGYRVTVDGITLEKAPAPTAGKWWARALSAARVLYRQSATI